MELSTEGNWGVFLQVIVNIIKNKRGSFLDKLDVYLKNDVNPTSWRQIVGESSSSNKGAGGKQYNKYKYIKYKTKYNKLKLYRNI